MPPQPRVPVRTIAATIGMVLLTAAVLLLGWEVRRVLTWIVVAALLAVILGPLVDLTERRLHLRRALATLLVFLVAIVALAGILTVFIRPLASEGPQFINRVPGYVDGHRAVTPRFPRGASRERRPADRHHHRRGRHCVARRGRGTAPTLGGPAVAVRTRVRAHRRPSRRPTRRGIPPRRARAAAPQARHRRTRARRSSALPRGVAGGQGRFVDDPTTATHEADTLATKVLRQRGYPVEDFDRQADDVSVDHPEVAENYRAAHALALANDQGLASTEDLRQAFVHYRSLFAELLGTQPDGHRKAVR